MMDFRVRLTPEASGLFSRFHPEIKRLIKARIKELRRNPYSGDDLQEELSAFKSFKFKRYRTIYKINEEGGIEIYYIGHRTDVYEQFRLLLNRLA